MPTLDDINDKYHSVDDVVDRRVFGKIALV